MVAFSLTTRWLSLPPIYWSPEVRSNLKTDALEGALRRLNRGSFRIVVLRSMFALLTITETKEACVGVFLLHCILYATASVFIYVSYAPILDQTFHYFRAHRDDSAKTYTFARLLCKPLQDKFDALWWDEDSASSGFGARLDEETRGREWRPWSEFTARLFLIRSCSLWFLQRSCTTHNLIGTVFKAPSETFVEIASTLVLPIGILAIENLGTGGVRRMPEPPSKLFLLHSIGSAS